MMLHRIFGRGISFPNSPNGILPHCRRRSLFCSSNGSVRQQTAYGGIRLKKENNISQETDDDLTVKIKMCNSLGEIALFASSQGESLSSSYVHDLLRQVRTILHQTEGKMFEGANVHQGNLSSLLVEMLILGPEAETDLAKELSEQIAQKLDGLSSVEFQVFLQFLSSAGKFSYTNLKTHLPDLDKTLAVKCFALAEEHSSSEIGPFLLLALAKLGLDFRLHPIPSLCQWIFQEVDSYSIKSLGILGELVSRQKLWTSWYASCLIRIFQSKFDELNTPSHFAWLTHSTIHLSSADFKAKIWDKFQTVFHSSADADIDVLLCMMQSSIFFDHWVKVQILERCSVLMSSQVSQMSALQMVKFLDISQHCHFKFEPLYQDVLGNLKNNALHLTTKRDIVLATDLLFRQPGAYDNVVGLVQKFMKVVDKNGTEELSKICVIAAMLRNQHPDLVTAVKKRCIELLPGIQDEALLNSLARFMTLKFSSKSPHVRILTDKLMRGSYKTITPQEHSFILTGLGKLGIPPSQIDPFVWSKMSKLLPNLRRESSRAVFMMLGQSKYFQVSPVDNGQLCNLQQDIFQKVLCKSPPRHLLLGGQRNSFSDQSDGADEDPSNAISRPQQRNNITKSNVVGVALYLNHTNMFYRDLVDDIVDIVHSDIDWFTPYELKDVLNLLASCNSSHPKIEAISERFATNLVDFFDKYSPFFAIESALHLVQLQIFHRKVLDKIFTWQFLEKLERLGLSRFMSHVLMQLNRAVCLEFPEMQAPWFHHEIDQANAFKNSRWTSVKTDVYEALIEILGRDHGELKTQNRTAYNLVADFEFTYDRDCSSHLSSPWSDTDKVIIDILPNSCYFRNASQLRGDFVMKKRHLEILGFKYIPIPQHDFRRSLLPFRSDKVDYLRKKLSY